LTSKLRLSLKPSLGFISYALIALILAYSLYQKALFFTPQQTTVSAIVIGLAFVGLFALYFMRRIVVPGWYAIPIAYATYSALCILWAAAANLAVDGAVIATAGVCFALIIPSLAPAWRRNLIVLLPVSSVMLYLFAMAANFGWLQYKDAIQTDMMDSVFQYHNAFGSYVLASTVIALVLAIDAKQYIARAAYALYGVIGIVAIADSYSRFVWAFTPIMLLLVLIGGIVLRRRLRTLSTLVITLLVGIAATPTGILAIHHHSLRDFVLTLVIAVIGAAVIPFFITWVDKPQRKSMRITAGVLIVVIPAILAVALLAIEASHLTFITQRLHSIRLGSTSLQERFWYYGACLKIWLHNPIFGSGAGTWTAKFQAYQQYPYWSTMTHSVFFDQLVSYGLIGILLWLGFIVTAVVIAIRFLLKNRDSAHALTVLAALIGAVSLLAHAIFDFDMNFPVMTWVFFLLLAVAASGGRSAAASNVSEMSYRERPKRLHSAASTTIFGGIAVLGTLALTLSLSQSANNSANGTTNPTAKLADLQHAAALAPYDGNVHMELASLDYQNYQKSHSTADKTVAWKQINSAVRHAHWDPNVQQNAALIAYQLGYSSQAYNWAHQAYLDGHFKQQYADTFMGISLWLGVGESHNNPQDAQRIFGAIQQVDRSVLQDVNYVAHLPKNVPAQWVFAPDAPMVVYTAAADYAQGNYQQSEAALKNIPTAGRDYNTVGLYDIVYLLDQAHLGQGSIANIPAEMKYKNAALQQELQILENLQPQKG